MLWNEQACHQFRAGSNWCLPRYHRHESKFDEVSSGHGCWLWHRHSQVYQCCFPSWYCTSNTVTVTETWYCTALCSRLDFRPYALAYNHGIPQSNLPIRIPCSYTIILLDWLLPMANMTLWLCTNERPLFVSPYHFQFFKYISFNVWNILCGFFPLGSCVPKGRCVHNSSTVCLQHRSGLQRLLQ